MSVTVTSRSTVIEPGVQAKIVSDSKDNIEVMQHLGQYVWVIAQVSERPAKFRVRTNSGREFDVSENELVA